MMSDDVWRSLLLSSGLLLAACFDPNPSPGGACAPGNRCPSPLECISNLCLEPGTVLDLPADAGVDGSLPPPPPPPVMCPAGYTRGASGTCYRMFGNMPESWLEAEARCEADGAHLVIPDSEAEALFVGDKSWIGISDRRTPGTFLTVTGRRPTFTYWAQNQPSMFPCVQTGNLARWLSVPCDFPFFFLCEFDGVRADRTSY